MDVRDMARALGSRGGRARAARLPADERRRIAALGGHARKRSLEATKRIEDNLRYLEAARELSGDPPLIRRVSTCRGPLPGIRANRS